MLPIWQRDGTRIHVDLQKTADSGWAAFTWLLAHEYGHNIHYEVAGSIPRTDVWFNEGFAEWVAAKAFDALGWQSYGQSIHRVTNETSRHLDLLPRLVQLYDIQGWRRTMGFTRGNIRTYSLALVAFDRLIQTKKLNSAAEILSSHILDHEFKQEFMNYLSSLRRQPNATFIVKQQYWRLNDKWTYEIRRAAQKTLAEKQFVREGVFVGVPAYVVRSGSEESFFAKDSLGLLATTKNRQYASRVSNIDRVISWPMLPNKEWRNQFTREDNEVGAIRSPNQLMRVNGVEKIGVKAGSFTAIKIEAYGYNSGRLFAEYWYSPQIKWFAKARTYDRYEGLIEEELVSFNVH